jgi:tRNA (guanine37-N1)-methyltransferase
MIVHIITVLPELLESPFAHSILKRAQQKGLASVLVHNLRDFSNDKHKSVDDYAFGGGAGMVMMIEPIVNCIEFLKKEHGVDEVIYMTPDGERFSQTIANQLSLKTNIAILCGHRRAGARAFHHARNFHRRLCALGRRTCGCCGCRCRNSLNSGRAQR